MDGMFLFKAPWGLLRHYSFCALWKGVSAGANLPIFSHGFHVFPLNPVHELSLWCVKNKNVLCPISTHFTHRNAILLFHILFHFSTDPGKNWFGIFFSFVSFFRHSNFSLSQGLYYWSCVVCFTLANISIPIPIGLVWTCWTIWQLASSWVAPVVCVIQ